MVTRSELRNACYRAKKGVDESRHQHLLDLIQPLLSVGETWENFPQKWDLIVKGDQIKIIKPETNYDYIHSTLLEISMYVKKDMLDHAEFSDRQLNIMAIVDALMLDGVTTWENYNKVWGVSVDPEIKQVSLVLYNVKDTQIKVTDEMIKASMKDADGAAMIEIPSIPTSVLETKPMDANQSKAFEEFLKRKYSK